MFGDDHITRYMGADVDASEREDIERWSRE